MIVSEDCFKHSETGVGFINETESDMSYTELEHGYQVNSFYKPSDARRLTLTRLCSQGLRNASRPMFYIGDINTVQPSVIPSIYRSSKRVSLGIVISTLLKHTVVSVNNVARGTFEIYPSAS